MRIAVISDIHDNVWNLEIALRSLSNAGAMICCGDLCSPFIVHQLGRGFSNPIHIVFGNNDADLFRITSIGARYPHVHLHGELFRAELGGRQVAAQHFDSIARPIAAAGEFDVVCYGHNHIYDVRRIGRTLAINPGSILGAQFGADGSRMDVAPSFVIYDSAHDTVESYRIGEDRKVVSLAPGS
jgi:putative phosphoesterase